MWINKIFRNLCLLILSFFCRTKCRFNGHNSKSVKILANGPSLRDDLDNLIQTDSICVLNFFCFEDKFWQFKPQHYVLADPAFFEKENLCPEQIRLYELINLIDWDIIFYVPLRYYFIFKNRTRGNKHISIKTVYRLPIFKVCECSFLEFFLFKKGLHAPSAQNVLIPSIFTMMNEGYDKIYLYGADHSWISQMKVNTKNLVCLVDKHFYDKEEPKLKPWLNGSDKTFKMHELMKIFTTVFLSYYCLENYSRYLVKTKIFNMTKNSFIDAFNRQ